MKKISAMALRQKRLEENMNKEKNDISRARPAKLWNLDFILRMVGSL